MQKWADDLAALEEACRDAAEDLTIGQRAKKLKLSVRRVHELAEVSDVLDIMMATRCGSGIYEHKCVRDYILEWTGT